MNVVEEKDFRRWWQAQQRSKKGKSDDGGGEHELGMVVAKARHERCQRKRLPTMVASTTTVEERKE